MLIGFFNKIKLTGTKGSSSTDTGATELDRLEATVIFTVIRIGQ